MLRREYDRMAILPGSTKWRSAVAAASVLALLLFFLSHNPNTDSPALKTTMGLTNGQSAAAKQSVDAVKALETLSIAAPDGSIRGSFIRVGAHITHLYV